MATWGTRWAGCCTLSFSPRVAMNMVASAVAGQGKVKVVFQQGRGCVRKDRLGWGKGPLPALPRELGSSQVPWVALPLQFQPQGLIVIQGLLLVRKASPPPFPENTLSRHATLFPIPLPADGLREQQTMALVLGPHTPDRWTRPWPRPTLAVVTACRVSSRCKGFLSRLCLSVLSVSLFLLVMSLGECL